MSERMRDWVNVGDLHTLPVNDLVDHDQVRTCWCQPKFYAPCPEQCKHGCWRCDNDEDGMISVEADYDSAVQVLHNAADGRE